MGILDFLWYILWVFIVITYKFVCLYKFYEFSPFHEAIKIWNSYKRNPVEGDKSWHVHRIERECRPWRQCCLTLWHTYEGTPLPCPITCIWLAHLLFVELAASGKLKCGKGARVSLRDRVIIEGSRVAGADVPHHLYLLKIMPHGYGAPVHTSIHTYIHTYI